MVIITHLIRILGKHSKRVRRWYYKRTDRCIWGIVRYIKDNECVVDFNAAKIMPVSEFKDLAKKSLNFELKSIEKITGVNIYEFELGEEWTIPPGSWEWIED